MKPSLFPSPARSAWLLIAILWANPLPAQTQPPTLFRSSLGASLEAPQSSTSPGHSGTAWTADAPAAPSGTMRAIAADGQLAAMAEASGNQRGSSEPVPIKRTPLNPTPRDEGPQGELGGTKSALQMLVSLGSSLLIVVALFLGVAWIYRKSMRNGLGQGLPKQVIDVLGRTPIAARQQLVLVRFGPKLVLISIVQGEARAISEIDEPLEVDRLAGLCESSKPGSISQSFRHVLAQGGAA